MPEIGQMLSHYKILEKIGEGGMGEVYLAEDLTLDRKVALKFLPEAFTSDPERMARFEREAKLLASLNHSNIAGIHGLEQADGNRFLVLEYVEGETLQARLSKGALPLEDALSLCRQIAEGLEAAHEKGVIHRDLKPANVMITAEEKVKILDFGLAKALLDETQSIDSSQSPTLTEAMTRPGVILGTAAYMSPEQAKGKSVDKRADIWAFGCILYECLTGKKAFGGETVTEILAAVIKEEPNWEVLPSHTPQNIRYVLSRCLDKNKRQRFHCVADLRIETEIERKSDESTMQLKQVSPWFAWSLAAVLLITLAIVSFVGFRHKQPSVSEPMQFQIPIQLDAPYNSPFALSPNGRHLVFSAVDKDGLTRLYIRSLNSLKIRPLPSTERSQMLPFFWSPDSRYIAFGTDGKLEKLDLSNDVLLPITDITNTAAGGSWNSDDMIIYSDYNGTNGIMKVLVSGGSPSPVTKPDPELNETVHILPVFLPDGRNFLYYCFAYNRPEISGIYIGSLDAKPEEQKRRKILDSTSAVIYVPSGKTEEGSLLYMRNQSLFSRTFDENRLELTGEEKILTDGVGNYQSYGCFSASMDGILVFRSFSVVNPKMIRLDREGKELGVVLDPGEYRTFDLSRDGHYLVYAKGDISVKGTNLWVKDLLRSQEYKITFDDDATHGDPRWSHDGKQVIYGSSEPTRGFFVVTLSNKQSTRIFEDEGPRFYVSDWSPDEKYILYQEDNSPELWARPVGGDQKPFLVTRANTGRIDQAQFSPDGRLVAYNSTESGFSQVCVVPFSPTPTGNEEPIVIDNGMQPNWKSDDRRELYYLKSDGTLMAVNVFPGETPKYGKPHKLFKTQLDVVLNMEQYVPFPDGKSFLFVMPSTDDASKSFAVYLNWPSMLKQ
jgi:serine/threonine protein kinase